LSCRGWALPTRPTRWRRQSGGRARISAPAASAGHGPSPMRRIARAVGCICPEHARSAVPRLTTSARDSARAAATTSRPP